MAGDAIRVIVKKNDLQLLARMAPQRAEDAILALAREGERYVKQAMQESPASGEAYPRGGRVHIASSPGNPPRIDTGTLINSISARRVGRLMAAISTGVDYAPGLEYGTKKMAPRPVWMPMAMWLPTQARRVFRNFIG